MTRHVFALLLTASVFFPQAALAQDEGKDEAQRMPEIAKADLSAIDKAITELYASISGPVGQERDRERFMKSFAEDARLIAMRPTDPEVTMFAPDVMTPDEYADRNLAMLSEVGFVEEEISRKLEVYGTIAHAFSTYEGTFTNNEGNEQEVKGINSIQLVKVEDGWKVMTILWDQQWPGGVNPVPERYLTTLEQRDMQRNLDFEPAARDDITFLPERNGLDSPDDVTLDNQELEARRVLAEQCPHCKKFFPLLADGTKPTHCPACDEAL